MQPRHSYRRLPAHEDANAQEDAYSKGVVVNCLLDNPSSCYRCADSKFIWAMSAYTCESD
jgi:hypothetical protein